MRCHARAYDGATEDVKIAFGVASSRVLPLRKRPKSATKKAAKAKMIRRGVKEVVKALKKGDQGLVIIAGDISPIDVRAACSHRAWRLTPPLARRRCGGGL